MAFLRLYDYAPSNIFIWCRFNTHYYILIGGRPSNLSTYRTDTPWSSWWHLDMGQKFTPFDLQRFGLSDKKSGSSLSVESIGFISNFPVSFLERGTSEIYQLVQSRALWLQSSGSSQFHVTVILNDEHMSSIMPSTEYLEDMAEAICQCSVRLMKQCRYYHWPPS